MTETINYVAFNIKLQSSKRGNDRKEAYINLIKKMTQKPIRPFQISKHEAIVFYESSKQEIRDTEYLYGRLAKGGYIPGNERLILKDGEESKEENDPNVISNPSVGRYLFIPKIHRLFVEKGQGYPSPAMIEKYLLSELPKLIDKDEKLEVILEQDQSIIQEIFTAKAVFSLSYQISYTNDDLLPDLADALDQELKNTNVGKLSVVATSDNKTEGLKIEDSKFLKGGLELAKQNGEIRNAEIIPANGNKKKKIKSKNKPNIFSIKFDVSENSWVAWVKDALKPFN